MLVVGIDMDFAVELLFNMFDDFVGINLDIHADALSVEINGVLCRTLGAQILTITRVGMFGWFMVIFFIS